jgi:hypothetical protein
VKLPSFLVTLQHSPHDAVTLLPWAKTLLHLMPEECMRKERSCSLYNITPGTYLLRYDRARLFVFH